MVVFLSPLASIPLMTKEASSFNVLSCDSIEQIVVAEAFQNISPYQILFVKLEYYGIALE